MDENIQQIKKDFEKDIQKTLFRDCPESNQKTLEEENTMNLTNIPAKTEYVMRFNGRDASDYSDGELLQLIQQHKDAAKQLKELEINGAYLDKQSKAINEAVECLMKELNERAESQE